MMIRRLTILLITVIVSTVAVYAQSNLDMSQLRNVDVATLSDDQIKQIYDKMKSKGYSWQQVRAMGKARGMSDSQLSLLESRLKSIKNSTTKSYSKAQQTTTTTKKSSNVLDDKNLVNITLDDPEVFGYEMFNVEKLTFEPNANIPVSDNYILGAGDEIVIDLRGNSTMNYDVYVETSGAIELPLVGPIYVAGLSISEARRRIEQKLSTIVSDIGHGTIANIHTGKLRTINVTIMGEVRAPGTYTINGAASLFNALHFSGGPSFQGSFRDIQLIRKGKIVAHLDVYDLIVRGKIDEKEHLLDGDIILVPTYQKRVRVEGEFKRTGYFEAKEGETVKDIIEFAGGFSAYANTKAVELYHVGPKGLNFKSVDLNSSELIANGDSIVARKLKTGRLDNMVNIEGGVFKPGNYEYTEGLTLKDLVDQAGGLQENAFPYRGVITRLKADHTTLMALNFNVDDLRNGKYNTQLQANDSIQIAVLDSMIERSIVIINGAVNKPGEYNYREGLSVGDLILLAGGTKEFASTHVSIVRRLDYSARETETIRMGEMNKITINKDLSLDDKGSNELLMPYDVVTVYEYPTANVGGIVTLNGEVMYSGEYSLLSKNETVSQLIERAGGLTSSAYAAGARLYRMVLLSDKERLIKEQQAFAMGDTSIHFEDKYELVSFELNDILTHKKGALDMILKNGDEIDIPMQQQTVRVGGEVLNPISVSYVEGDNAKDYILKAGGFSSNARKRSTYVVMPNGKAVATRHFLFFRRYPKVEPGSEVIVPTKPESTMSVPTVVSIASSLTTIAVLIISVIK